MSYESILKAQRDYYSSISYAEKKAMEKGIEKGMEKGMEKGKEKKSFEVVENLLTKLDLTDQQAADIAEVPVNFVKKIRTSLKKTVIFPSDFVRTAPNKNRVTTQS